MKRKILACVLACATLFLGMGYAYWTDSLQLDTTATTGELEVKFVDLALYGQYDWTDNEFGWAIVDGVVEDNDNPGYTEDWYFQRGNDGTGEEGGLPYNHLTDQDDIDRYNERVWGFTRTTSDAILVGKQPIDVTIDGYTAGETMGSNRISINMNKIYPGYAQVFQADIVNTGTIAAKLADIEFEVTKGNETIKNMIGVSMEVLREYAGDAEDGTLNPQQDHVPVFNTEMFTAADKFTVGGIEFVRLSALQTAMAGDEVNDLYDTIYVLPDNCRMDLYIGIAMDPDEEGDYTTGSTADINTDNNDSDSENKTAKFNVDFQFDQFNIGVPEDGDNEHLDPAPGV